MGFFSNFRSATTIVLSKQLIQRHLEVETACGAFKGDAKKLAEDLVMNLWSKSPELAQEQHKVHAVLVAAAALANGISHFDSQNDKTGGDILFRCLSALIQYDLSKLPPDAVLDRTNQRLLNLAYAVFDEK